MAGHGVPEILFAFGRPLVAPFGDGRGRRDGIDRHRLVQAVGDVGGGLAAVNGFENRCFFHVKSMVWRLVNLRCCPAGPVTIIMGQLTHQWCRRPTLFCQTRNIRCKPAWLGQWRRKNRHLLTLSSGGGVENVAARNLR